MITSSFIFIPGIGEKTEEYLWKSGILSWDDFKKTDVPFLNETKKESLKITWSWGERRSIEKIPRFCREFTSRRKLEII